VAKLCTQGVPPKPGPRIEIVRLKANQTAELTIYSPAVHGIWTHWIGSVSAPCWEPRAKCEHCKNNAPRRWKGYLFCWHQGLSDNIFIELTPASTKSIMDVVGPVASLRGYRMFLQRGNGDKAWLKVVLRSRFQDVSDSVMPDDVSPEKTLRQLWGVSDDSPLDA